MSIRVICPFCGVFVRLVRGVEIPIHYEPASAQDCEDDYDLPCQGSGQDYEDDEEDVNEEDDA